MRPKAACESEIARITVHENGSRMAKKSTPMTEEVYVEFAQMALGRLRMELGERDEEELEGWREKASGVLL